MPWWSRNAVADGFHASDEGARAVAQQLRDPHRERVLPGDRPATAEDAGAPNRAALAILPFTVRHGPRPALPALRLPGCHFVSAFPLGGPGTPARPSPQLG